MAFDHEKTNTVANRHPEQARYDFRPPLEVRERVMHPMIRSKRER